jgi:uncharacterized MAPEG superfamily protein
MTSPIEALPFLTGYQSAFLVLGLLALLALVQSFLCAPLSFVHEEQVPGMPLRHDHSKLSFRALRTYSNTVENLPAFTCALLVAIAAGVSPELVNWLAGIYLAFRLAFWAVYYAGIGREAGGPRTLCYVGGLLANIVLACAAVWALI